MTVHPSLTPVNPATFENEPNSIATYPIKRVAKSQKSFNSLKSNNHNGEEFARANFNMGWTFIL